jgi:hypothetical protein
MNLTIQHDPEKWFKWFLLIISLVTLVIFMNSCSCDYYLSRAKSKCDKSILSDTLIVHDTIYVKGDKMDTTFYYVQKDTVIVQEGRLVMKYFYNTHDSTVYLKGQCLPDTVFYEKQIITNNLELKADPLVKYRYWIIGLFLVLLIFAILRK